MQKITITIELDIPDEESWELPVWIKGKKDEEIVKFADENVFNFIRDVLKCDSFLNEEWFTEVEKDE